ncbi:MAG TPA: dTDP-4-dehydrorhamnose reductase [Asticcacaulis sp.]|nr:dTDP-4-dehydrorhamnose reductase [Asticcacaulis sp.]
MRILVTGTQGQVVTALKAANADVIALGRPDIDLAEPGSLRAPITAARPDVMVSAAAYTAVDKAESEPDLARAINGEAPGELARIAAELGVPLLHLSTDYVFNGARSEPYAEDDATGPVSVYGATKLMGEEAIRAATPNHIILRTAWVYSPFGGNFVRTMLRLAETRDEVNVVDDQLGCPTYAPDIARAVLAIARRAVADRSPCLRGTFHLTAPDETTWAGFAQAIFAGLTARGGKKVIVNPIPSSAYPTPARRPANSRLNGKKLEAAYGIVLPSWRVSLDACLDILAGTTKDLV